LILNQIRFESEIRKPEGLNIPPEGDLSEKEIEIAIMLIDQLSSPFKPEDFKDTYAEEISKSIEEKVRTGKISSIDSAVAEKPGEVIDLLEKLKLSLEEAKKKNAS